MPAHRRAAQDHLASAADVRGRALRTLAVPHLRRTDARRARLADRARSGRCFALPRSGRRTRGIEARVVVERSRARGCDIARTWNTGFAVTTAAPTSSPRPHAASPSAAGGGAMTHPDRTGARVSPRVRANFGTKRTPTVSSRPRFQGRRCTESSTSPTQGAAPGTAGSCSGSGWTRRIRRKHSRCLPRSTAGSLMPPRGDLST